MVGFRVRGSGATWSLFISRVKSAITLPCYGDVSPRHRLYLNRLDVCRGAGTYGSGVIRRRLKYL